MMRDDQEKKRQAEAIEQELKRGLSRRAFLDRLKAIGVGFGAAFVFGVNRSEAAVPGEALVNLKSTNPVLNDIVEGSRQDQLPDNENTTALDDVDDEARLQLVQYRRISYRRLPYGRVIYKRIPYLRGPYGRIPYRRVPYLRGPYARVPYARVRF
jgi:hypothetical protein